MPTPANQVLEQAINITYDPAGNRISKQSTQDTATAQGKRKYIVDTVADLPTILLELDPDDNMKILKSYIYADSQILAQHDGGHTDDLYFYLHDRLGSARLLIDQQANVVNRYTYSPFGQLLENDTSDEPQAPSNCFMFTGQFFDSEIGQYYLRNRDYNPDILRFTSRDPADGKFDQPLTINKYLYCGNNPVNWIDPWGLDSVAIYDPADKGYLINSDGEKKYYVRDKLGIPHRLAKGADFRRAASCFDYAIPATSPEEAAALVDLLSTIITIDDLYIFDHGEPARQYIGDEWLEPWEADWYIMSAAVASGGTVHLRGCEIVKGGKDSTDWWYLKGLAMSGLVAVDAYDEVVLYRSFRYGKYYHYSAGNLWRADYDEDPHAISPDVVSKGSGRYHWKPANRP